MKVRKKTVQPGAEKKLDAAAAQRGLDRKEYFANGGTALGWKGGTSHTFKDRKAEAKRRACRGKAHQE